MKTILLTGFEPFGGSHINPSIEACKPLDGKLINGVKIKVVQIPLRYDEVKPDLIKAIEETKPVSGDLYRTSRLKHHQLGESRDKRSGCKATL